jgi:Domain of unknown function (DUF6457)
MTGREWVKAFAAALGVDAPDDREVEILLALAGHAAHSSERWAAPLACWVVARAGVDPASALEQARRMPGGDQAPA